MAINSIDARESFGFTTTLLEIFTTTGAGAGSHAESINATGGRGSRPSFRYVTTSSGGNGTVAAAIIPLKTSSATKFQAFAYRTTALPPSGGVRIILQFRQGGSVQVDIRVNSAGDLFFTRAGTTLAGTTLSGAVIPNVYIQLQPKLFVDNTTGTITLRVNGSTSSVIAATGLDTQATATAAVDAIALCAGGAAADPQTCDFCDVMVNPDDWFGDGRCDYLPDSVAGWYSDFIPSSAVPNETTIDEIGSPTADHNASQVVGDKDSFTGGTIPTTATVIAVSPVMRHNKQDAGLAQDMFLFRQGGVDYTTGTAFNPSFGSDQYVREDYVLNPATTAAFTPTEINGTLERGYTRSA